MKRKEHSNGRTTVSRSDVQLAAKAHGMDEYAYVQQLCSHGQSYTYYRWNAWAKWSGCSKGYIGYKAGNSHKKPLSCGSYVDSKGRLQQGKCKCIDGHSNDDKFHWLCYGENVAC